MSNKDRKIRFIIHDEGVVIIEETAYVPTGAGRRKWAEDRVALTREEVARLAKQMGLFPGRPAK